MRTFRDYARSSVENLDARKAYRWASGLCAATALALALDASCVEDKYGSSPYDNMTDIQVLASLKREAFVEFSDGRLMRFSTAYRANPPRLDVKVRDPRNPFDSETEYFLLYPLENDFTPKDLEKVTTKGRVPLTEKEIEDVKDVYRPVFSKAAKQLRIELELERRLVNDVLRKGKVTKYYREPIFDYSWMPDWVSKNILSRRVVMAAEKEYYNGSKKIVLQASRDSSNEDFFGYIVNYREVSDGDLGKLFGMEDE